MNPGCVLDASVVARWWLPAETDDARAHEAALELLQAYVAGKLDVYAPDLLYAEVANVFWKAVQFREWPPEAARQGMRDLLDLPLSTCTCQRLLPLAGTIALAHRVTVYDALYVALARAEGVPLYTTDRKLLRTMSGAVPEVRPLVMESGGRRPKRRSP